MIKFFSLYNCGFGMYLVFDKGVFVTISDVATLLL